MTPERAMEILDPEHREHYESMEPVNEACRMGMEALRRVQVLERALQLACECYVDIFFEQYKLIEWIVSDDKLLYAHDFVMPEIIKEAEKELEEQRNAKIHRRE